MNTDVGNALDHLHTHYKIAYLVEQRGYRVYTLRAQAGLNSTPQSLRGNSIMGGSSMTTSAGHNGDEISILATRFEELDGGAKPTNQDERDFATVINIIRDFLKPV